MKNAEFQLDDQIIKTLRNYAEMHQYDVIQLANELIEISTKRLDIDVLEEYNKDEENKLNKARLTSKDKEQEIRTFFDAYRWGVVSEENKIYGEIFERYIGKKVFYYFSNDIKNPYIIITDEKMDFISELVKNSHFETNQIFSWVCQYRKETKILKLGKEEKNIEVIIC